MTTRWFGDGLVPEELAAQVPVPTLILTAEARPGTARALAEVMPRARVQTLRASTHDLTAAEIAAAVTPFFSQPAG